MPKTPIRAGSAVRRPTACAAVTATPPPSRSRRGLARRGRLGRCPPCSPALPEGLDLRARAPVDAAGARHDHAEEQEAAYHDALLLRRDVLQGQRLAQAAQDREREHHAEDGAAAAE